mmetsp:Transcript_19121/g.45580  ORF Transcript_19121/g.45580 Transcript_19121/m.45580 type:complete len:245 (-) Transcript_19121:1081-1815(-)
MRICVKYLRKRTRCSSGSEGRNSSMPCKTVSKLREAQSTATRRCEASVAGHSVPRYDALSCASENASFHAWLRRTVAALAGDACGGASPPEIRFSGRGSGAAPRALVWRIGGEPTAGSSASMSCQVVCSQATMHSRAETSGKQPATAASSGQPRPYARSRSARPASQRPSSLPTTLKSSTSCPPSPWEALDMVQGMDSYGCRRSTEAAAMPPPGILASRVESTWQTWWQTFGSAKPSWATARTS